MRGPFIAADSRPPAPGTPPPMRGKLELDLVPPIPVAGKELLLYPVAPWPPPGSSFMSIISCGCPVCCSSLAGPDPPPPPGIAPVWRA
jgi:hypothetical protein